MKRMICCVMLLVIALVSIVPMTAAAAEIPDWDTVDWESFHWGSLDKSEIWSSLKEWLKNEASLEKLFDAWQNFAHEAYATTANGIACQRFYLEPEAFLIALAKEDTEFQDRTLRGLSEEMSFPENRGECVGVLEGIRLSAEQDPDAVALMLKLIDQAEERLGVTITVPKTGDPVAAVLAALLFSGGGVLLLRKKRIV